MIDAEHTYFQPAIDSVVAQLQERHNRKEALILGTYQCYRRDVHERLALDVERARREVRYHTLCTAPRATAAEHHSQFAGGGFCGRQAARTATAYNGAALPAVWQRGKRHAQCQPRWFLLRCSTASATWHACAFAFPTAPPAATLSSF